MLWLIFFDSGKNMKKGLKQAFFSSEMVWIHKKIYDKYEGGFSILKGYLL